jgi:hypothetical protein
MHDACGIELLLKLWSRDRQHVSLLSEHEKARLLATADA